MFICVSNMWPSYPLSGLQNGVYPNLADMISLWIPSKKLSLSHTNELISSLIQHPPKCLLNPQVCVKQEIMIFKLISLILLCATKHINVLFFYFFCVVSNTQTGETSNCNGYKVW